MIHGDSHEKGNEQQDPLASTSPYEILFSQEEVSLESVLEELRSYYVSPEEMALEVRNLLCDEICSFRALRYLDRRFSFRCNVDEDMVNRGKSELLVHFLTPEAQQYAAEDSWLCETSRQEHSAMLLLGDISFKDPLVEHLQFRKCSHIYRFHPPLPESEMEALRRHEAENHQMLVQRMEHAVLTGKAVICGEIRALPGTTARERLEAFFLGLVEAAYPKMALIQRPAKDEAAVWNSLQGLEAYNLFEGDTDVGNPDALADLRQWLEEQFAAGSRPSLGNVYRRYTRIPYGWLPLDIGALLIQLLADQEISVWDAGIAVSQTEPKLPAMLCRKPSEAITFAPSKP